MNWRTANHWKLAVIRCCFWMQFYTPIVVAYFTTVSRAHLTLEQVLFLNAWFMLGSFVVAVFAGAVGDFFGRRLSVVLSFVLAGAGIAGYIAAPSFAMLLAVEAVFAFTYMFANTDEALAVDSIPEEHRSAAASQALSFLETAKLVGILVSALLGGFIAARWGLRAPLFAYCAPIAVGFLVALTLTDQRGATDEAATRPSGYLDLIVTGFRIFAADRMLQLVAFEAAVTNALVWTLIWLFQPLLQRSGVPIAFFGLVQAGASVAQIAILTNVARLERVVGSLRRMVVIASFGAAAALITLGISSNGALEVAAIVVALALGLCRQPLYAAEMNARIPSSQRATALAVTGMVRTLAIAVVNPIAGHFADRSLPSTLLALGIALAAVTLLFIVLRHNRATA